MKQGFIFSIMVIFILTAGTNAAVSGDYEYSDNGNGTCTITGYIGPGGDITIPHTLNGLNVTRIGDYGFSDCSSLNAVTIPDSVKKIGKRAFYRCSNLSTVTIPSVKSIGDYAFSDCLNLSGMTIPGSVTTIGSRVFADCENLTAVNVEPSNSAYISVEGVLLNKAQTELIQYPCGKTGEYTIPSSVTSIKDDAFRNCRNLTSVIIPHNVTSIGISAFEDCSALTSATIGNGINSLPDYAFSGCSSLTSVILPNDPYYYPYLYIGRSTFSGCSSLTSVTIPDSVDIIDSSAFSGCSSLTSVNIPHRVKHIGNSVFSGCTSLKEITVDPFNPDYSSLDGVLFSKDQKRLTQYPGGRTGEYSIPDSVHHIGNSAFSDCLSLNTVIIPDSVTRIDSFAFLGCSDLMGLFFKGNPAALYVDVFYGVADDATVYYLPGTVGWEATYGGLPTALLLPVADAGADQTVYAFTDRYAMVQLDGTGSYDVDGDTLEYYWYNGNDLIAEGAEPDVVLEVGEHVIDLIVTDGIADSEPNSCVVKVIEPFETTVRMLPGMINLKSKRPQLIGRIEFAGEAMPVLDPNEPMLLLVGASEMEAERQMLVYSDEALAWYLVGFFDSAAVIENLTAATETEITLVSRFDTGQWVYGNDVVKVK